MAPTSPRAARRRQPEQQSQLEESDSSDTDSPAEDDGKTVIASKSAPVEVLDLSGDDEDCEMVYTGPKITKLAPIQLESDSDKDQRADSSSPPSASTRSKTRAVSTLSPQPGPSAAPTTSTSAPTSTPARQRERRTREPMSQLLMDLCRGRARVCGGIRRRPTSTKDQEFTDYTSSEEDEEDKPTSSQKAAAASATSSTSAPVDPDGDVVICNVCKCPLIRGAVRLVPCDHKFHRSCLDDWLERRKKDFQNCPLCRQLPTEVRRLKGGRKVRIPSPVPDDATSEDEEMLTGMVFSDEEESGEEGEEEDESGSEYIDEDDPDLQRALQRSLSEPAGEVRHSPEPAIGNPVTFDDIMEEDDGVEAGEESMDGGEEEPTGEALSRSPTRMESSDDERESGEEIMDVTERRRVLTRRRQKEEEEDSDARDRREDEEEEEEKRLALRRRSARMIEQVERELQRSRTAFKSRSSEDRAVARGEEEDERRRALSRMERIEMDAEEGNVRSAQQNGGEMEASEQEAEEEEEEVEKVVEGVEGVDGGEDEEALTDEEIPDEEGEEESSGEESEEENEDGAVVEGEEKSDEESGEEVANEAVVKEEPAEEEEDTEEGEEENKGESTDGRDEEKSVSQSLPSPYESLPLAPRPQMCSPSHVDFAALAAAQIPPEAAAALAVAVPIPPTNSPMEKEVVISDEKPAPVRLRFIDKLRPNMYQAFRKMKKEGESDQNDSTTTHEDLPSSSTDSPARATRSRTASKTVKGQQDPAVSSSPPNSPMETQFGVNKGHLLKVEVNAQEMLSSSSTAAAARKPALRDLDISVTFPPQTDSPTRSPMASGDNTEQPKRKRLIDKMRPHMYDRDLFDPPGTTKQSSSSQPQKQASSQEKMASSQPTQSAPQSSPTKPLKPLEIPPTVSPQAAAPTNSPMDAGDNMEPEPKRTRLIDRMRNHMYDYFDIMRQKEREEREQQPCSSKDPRLPENMPSTSSSALQPLNPLVIPPSSPSPPLPGRIGPTRTPSVIIDEESTEKARQSSSSSSSSPSAAADPYRDLSPASRRRAEEEEIELISSTMALLPVMELTHARRAARAAGLHFRLPPPPPRADRNDRNDRTDRSDRKRKSAIMDEPIPERRTRRSERLAGRTTTSTAAGSAAQPSTSSASDPALLRARSPPVQRMSTPEINRILTTRMPAEEEANIADANVNDALKEAMDAWYTKVLRAGGRVGKRMLTTAIKLALQNTDAVAKGKKEAWIPNCDWDPDVERTATVAIQTRSRSTTPEDSPPPDDTISRAEFNQMVRELAVVKRRLADIEKRK